MTKANEEAKVPLTSAIPHKLGIWKPEWVNIPKGAVVSLLSFFPLETAQYFVNQIREKASHHYSLFQGN